MDELKPCPFCGAVDIRFERSERVTKLGKRVITISSRYKVYCPKCSCGTGLMFSEETARELWNRRADNG